MTGPHQSPVPDTTETLVLDLLEWVGPEPRPYAEVLEAWRTSCPRLTVWEDAQDRGFIARNHEATRGALVSVSALGAEYLRKHRPLATHWDGQRTGHQTLSAMTTSRGETQ